MDALVQFWGDAIAKMRLVPVGQDEFFRRLWRDGRLRYRGETLAAGGIEELSARVLATAVRRRSSLFVVLPSDEARCTPALFATALLLDSIDKLTTQDKRVRRVVVFGTSVAMRSSLANITVHGLSLAQVFHQVHLQKNAKKAQGTGDLAQQLSEYFPEVVSALSPASVAEVLRRYKPTWIAADCDGAVHLEWLPDLLRLAKAQGVPIIGWVTGRLSPAVELLQQTGARILSWPPQNGHGGASTDDLQLSAESLFGQAARPTVLPLIVAGDEPRSIAESLAKARASLCRATKGGAGPLLNDCIRSGWGYLRALEGLHVPLRFFEAECRQFWGVRRLSSRREAFARFTDALGTKWPDARKDLLEALSALESAHELLGRADPPIWVALLATCVADADPAHPRCVVFGSAARRKLFELALLSIEGIVVSDLAPLAVSLSSLTELRSRRRLEIDDTPERPATAAGAVSTRDDIYMVGWPSADRQATLHAVLGSSCIRVLILPHQEGELRRRIAGLANALSISCEEVRGALQSIGVPVQAVSGAERLSPVTVHDPEFIDATGTLPDAPLDLKRSLWSTPDAQAEAELILRLDDDADDLSDSPSLQNEEELSEQTGQIEESLFLDSAIRVDLTDGRHILLPEDARFNSIRGAGQYETMKERPAAELRPGDRIVFIHGQRRQSLYEMLIQRVHAHPAIRLHLALINAWHEEVGRAYRTWSRQEGRGYEDLLREVRARGCQRSAALTIRFWVTGEIICPSDPEDLRRMADVLGIAFIKEHYLRVSKAADRLRGLHRGLANRLNNWLRSQAAGIPSDDDDSVFDEELGLTLGDFRASLEILAVSSVQPVTGPFLRTSLSRIKSE